MKVLFLDFDGVMNSHNGYAKRNYDEKELENPYPLFEEHIEPLNWLMNEVPGLQIVISSTWRKKLQLKEMRDMMVEKGFQWPEAVIGVTPVGDSRVNEIEQWISGMNGKVEKFIVVDDKNLKDIDDNFVRISNQYGFCHFDAVLCKQILTKQPAPVVFF